MTTLPPAVSRKPRPRRPGYFECKRILGRLHRLQDLVRHDQRWAHEIRFARPIEELLPGIAPNDRPAEIDRQIRRLIPLVAQDLKRAGIPREVSWPTTRYDPAKQRVVEEPGDRSYHLIGDYFHLPHDAAGSAFTEVIGALDMAIGSYEDLKRRGFGELFNPLAWIAHALHAPVWVMERAGLVDPEEPRSPILKGYVWLLRVTLFIVFALLLKKLGLGGLIGTIIR